MSSNAFSDVYDTNSLHNGGPSAKRRLNLKEYDAPLWVLDKLGVDVPHRDFSPEDAFEYPTTVTIDGTTVSLFQDVKEDMDDVFGDLGSAEDDEDDVVWTVSDLSDGTVNLMVVGEWSTRREVPYEEFANNYKPLTVTTDKGKIPKLGY